MAKLSKFEDFKTPWEEKGEDIDPARLKKYVYDLLSDRESRDATIASLRAENKTLGSELSTAKDASLTAEQRAEKAAEAQKERDARYEKLERENAKLRVGQEKGLNAKQMRYLTGDTEEDLAKNADQILEDFAGTDDSKGGGNGKPPTQRPQGRPAGKTGLEPGGEEFPTDASTVKDAAAFLPKNGWDD